MQGQAKPKIHKETQRVVSAIKKGGAPTYSASVNVGSWENFIQVAREVSVMCPETATMLGCVVEKPQRALYIGIVRPSGSKAESDAWMESSLACGATKEVSNKTGDNLHNAATDVCCVALTYEETSEQSPFKLVDQVFACGNAYLKRVGVYKEEEEEYEYGFDDI